MTTGDDSQIDNVRVTWAPLLGAFRDALEWSLDRAAHFARAYPDEVDTVERVRCFMRARMELRRPQIDIDDLLFTFALAVAAFDADLERVGAFVKWVKAHSIHIPFVSDLERQWVEQIVTTYEALQSRASAA